MLFQQLTFTNLERYYHPKSNKLVKCWNVKLDVHWLKSANDGSTNNNHVTMKFKHDDA